MIDDVDYQFRSLVDTLTVFTNRCGLVFLAGIFMLCTLTSVGACSSCSKDDEGSNSCASVNYKEYDQCADDCALNGDYITTACYEYYTTVDEIFECHRQWLYTVWKCLDELCYYIVDCPPERVTNTEDGYDCTSYLNPFQDCMDRCGIEQILCQRECDENPDADEPECSDSCYNSYWGCRSGCKDKPCAPTDPNYYIPTD